jgi:amidase
VSSAPPLGAGALAAAVRAGAASAEEVVRARRAEADRRPALNAIVSPRWDGALSQAKALDARVARGEPVGRLAGVPFTVKDVIAVAGLPVTAGSRAFAHSTATATAPAVQRLLAEDAILLGKTNCPEFAFGSTCDNDLFGATANPRFAGRSPGGSSGGEAAAVAGGLSAFGIGTDYGGSLRWPAQCTGIAAFRPTVGAIDALGQVPGAGGWMGVGPPEAPSPATMQGRLQTIGPMAPTVADLRLLFDVLRGDQRAGDQASGDPGGGDPGGGGDPAAALRIGWSTGQRLGPVRGEIAEAIARAAVGLEAAGHRVRPVPEAFADCLQTYNALRAIDPMVDHLAAVRGVEEAVGAASLRAFRDSLAGDDRARAAARAAADAAASAGLAVFESVDAVLLPVAGGPACLPDGTVDVDGAVVGGWALMAHCRAVSLLGAPSVSVPIGLTADGLPISAQVVAAPGRDDVALRVAALIERTP